MGYSWITILDILTLIYNQYGLLIPQNLGKNEICLKKPYIIPQHVKIYNKVEDSIKLFTEAKIPYSNLQVVFIY